MSEQTKTSDKKWLLPWVVLCLAAALAFLSMSWWQTRQELRLSQIELELANASLRDTRQQLEAERILSKRQIEMLREQLPQSALSPNTPNTQIKNH